VQRETRINVPEQPPHRRRPVRSSERQGHRGSSTAHGSARLRAGRGGATAKRPATCAADGAAHPPRPKGAAPPTSARTAQPRVVDPWLLRRLATPGACTSPVPLFCLRLRDGRAQDIQFPLHVDQDTTGLDPSPPSVVATGPGDVVASVTVAMCACRFVAETCMDLHGPLPWPPCYCAAPATSPRCTSTCTEALRSLTNNTHVVHVRQGSQPRLQSHAAAGGTRWQPRSTSCEVRTRTRRRVSE